MLFIGEKVGLNAGPQVDIADVARGIRANPFGRPIAHVRDTK
jgi:fructose-1,6-bisphosphatase/sedoheptulose 1,7-bisphosphatase-like protein